MYSINYILIFYMNNTDISNQLIKSEKIPEKIFIVPYRDREPHKMVFMRVMPHILGDSNYRILFIHQQDKRPFNRGGMKNIGFIYVKQTWPDHWKNITLIFHDIDFMSFYKDQFSFDTKQGEVNHFYGYKHTLGGIFAIKGIDYERTSGFPNIWTWGLEDNIIHERVRARGLKLVYPQFVHAQNNTTNIISLWHGWDRLLNPNVGLNKMHHQNDSFWSLLNIKYNAVELEDKILIVNVTEFSLPIKVSAPIVRNARIVNSRTHGQFRNWRTTKGILINNEYVLKRKAHKKRFGLKI